MFMSQPMNIDWANLTTSTVTSSEIGTMFVNRRIQVKKVFTNTVKMG